MCKAPNHGSVSSLQTVFAPLPFHAAWPSAPRFFRPAYEPFSPSARQQNKQKGVICNGANHFTPGGAKTAWKQAEQKAAWEWPTVTPQGFWMGLIKQQTPSWVEIIGHEEVWQGPWSFPRAKLRSSYKSLVAFVNINICGLPLLHLGMWETWLSVWCQFRFLFFNVVIVVHC